MALLLTVMFWSVAFPVAAPEQGGAYVLHAPISISDDAGFTTANGVVGGSGTQIDPYVIEGWQIDATLNNGISLSHTTAFVVIQNVVIDGGGGLTNATYLSYCQNVTISQCNLTSAGNGIYVDHSKDVVVRANQVSSCRSDGILILSSSRVKVLQNDIRSNSWAPFHVWPCAVSIQYPSSIPSSFSDNITVAGNLIHDNLGSAIGVGTFSTADTRDIRIASNMVTNNTDGIWTWGTTRITICGNHIENTPYAVYLEYTENAKIWANNFVNCMEPGYDDGGLENQWDDSYPIGGNYWSDYSGVDVKSGPGQNLPGSDGIGDTPRIIDPDSRDRYPLMSLCDYSSPTVTTWLSDTTITLGGTVYDTATVSGLGGSSLMPTGTVQFQVRVGAGPWTNLGSPVTLVNGSATSDSYTPVGVGTLYYHFKACYGGDSNYDPAESGEDDESLTVEPATPTVVTLLSSSSIALGESVTDTVTVEGLGGNFPEPIGTVQFQVKAGNGTWTNFGSPVALMNGSATSDSYTPVGVGPLYYHFKACYGGDGNYNPAESDEDSESLTVEPATPTVATKLSSSSITLGESVTDTVTLMGLGGSFPVPTGTVQFQVRAGAGPWMNLGSPVTLVNGSATSDSYTPLGVGPLYYHFKACYGGDGNYDPAESGEDEEPLTVVVIKLELVPGWNFITVPTVGFAYTAGTLGLQKMDIVVSWNPLTKAYDKTFIVGVSPPPLDFAILPSTGYWILAGAYETLPLNGMIPITTQTRTVTVPSGGGWVNLGFNTLNTTWKASMVPGMYSGGNVTMVAWYNATSGTYKTYIKGIPQSDFTLIPGQAYWIMCTASGTLTYTP